MRLPRLFEDLLELCFPGFCARCKASCAGNKPLCDPCQSELDALAAAPACEACGLPLAIHGSPCAHCKGGGVAHYDRIVRLGVFDEPLRTLIHHLKYHQRWPLGDHIADWLLQQERVKGLLSETQCLVPVPLHTLRQIERGYNQAEIIAQRLGHCCRIPLARPAARRRATEAQTHLHSRTQRMKNLSEAFELVKPDSIHKKHVVVIDDVMTTGATLQTFARALKPAKPASLSAIVVAVADPAGRGFELT